MRKPLGSHKNDEQVIDISPVVDEVVELANVTDLSRFAFDTDHEIPPKTPLQSPTEQIFPNYQHKFIRAYQRS